MTRDMRVMSFGEFRKLGVSKMVPRPHVVFVNRREAFQPHKELLDGTTPGNWGLNEYLRRLKDDPVKMEKALRGCKYDGRYRYMVTRSGEAMGQLREIAEESKRRPVLMVTDKDRPDADILVSIMRVFINNGVWR